MALAAILKSSPSSRAPIALSERALLRAWLPIPCQCMPAASDGSQRFLFGHINGVCALACSADGSTLATAEDGRVALIRVWDMAAGQCVAVLHGESPAGNAVGLGPAPRGLLASREPAACTSMHSLLLLALYPATRATFHKGHPHQCSHEVVGLPG